MSYDTMATTTPTPRTTTELDARYLSAHRTLRAVTVLVSLYAVGMVIAGDSVATPLFDALGFGPHSKELDAAAVEYAIFAFGVLGAVLLGWMTLVYFVVSELMIHPDADVRSLARRALVLSIVVWFVFDTGFSIFTGEINHALFNLPFISCLGGPLLVMAKTDNNDEEKKKKKKQ